MMTACEFQDGIGMTDDRKRKTGGEVELLPCPWCGLALSKARVSEGSTFRWRKVDGCCADGPEVRHDTMADDQAAAEADSHRRAIEAWNTRANVDRALAESRAECRKWREKYEDAWAEVGAQSEARAFAEARVDCLAEALPKVYEQGWCEAAAWAGRDDLYADIGSPAYTRDRDRRLAALNLEPTP